jgi:ribosome biogenesis GTPase A
MKVVDTNVDGIELWDFPGILFATRELAKLVITVAVVLCKHLLDFKLVSLMLYFDE